MSAQGVNEGRPDRGRDEPVTSITSVAPPLTVDQAHRTRVYLTQMGIRAVCIVAAVIVGKSWLLWVFLGAAVVLPYTAVLFANAGRDQSKYDSSPMTYRELGPADRQTYGQRAHLERVGDTDSHSTPSSGEES